MRLRVNFRITRLTEIQWRWSSSRSADRPREVEQPNNNGVEPLRVSLPKSRHLEIRHVADEGVMLAKLVLHRKRSPAGWLAHSRSIPGVRMCRFLDSLRTKVYGRLVLRTHFASLRYPVAVCLCSRLIISFPFHRLIRCSLLDSHSHLATESERAGNCGLRPCEVVGIPDVGWQNPKSPCSVIGSRLSNRSSVSHWVIRIGESHILLMPAERLPQHGFVKKRLAPCETRT